jgi:NodT family efflux transporter outer membrane factor (OMF) lipoprotein
MPRESSSPTRSTILLRASPFVVALLLAGCAVGPDSTPTTIDLPQRWHRSVDSRSITPDVLGEWWKNLGDPQLDALMTLAVEGNLDVAAAKAKIREARAMRREAVGGLLPSLDGAASATRKRSTSYSTGQMQVSNLFVGGFDASWEIDLFGGQAKTVEAASAGIEAAEADLDATLLTLVGDVASDYVEVRGYQARAALARRTAQSLRQTEALTRRRFEAGTASAVDTAKAEAAATNTEAGIPLLESAAAQAIHRLSILTGREPGALTAELRRERAIPMPRRSLPTGVPADVLRNRPDVRAAERRVHQSTAKLAASEAALYPSLSLTGAISTSATRVGDLGKGSTIGWSWGPSLTVPIFEGGRLVAARDASAAERDQYLIAWRGTVLTALGDVENSLVALSEERARTAKLTIAVDSLRRAASLSRSLYESGSSSFLDVLDAERSLYTGEDSLIQSRVAISTDHIALAKALGGGWRHPVEASKPEVVDTDTGPRFAGLPKVTEPEAKPAP